MSVDLFKDRSAEVVLQSYLKAKEKEEEKRRRAANERLSIFNDDWVDILETMMADQFNPENWKNIKMAINTSQNIVKKVVGEISIIYKDAPVRNIGENEILSDIYSYLNIDEFMKRVNKYGTLLNDVLIRVGWDAYLEQITLDLHTPANTSVIQRDNYPEQAAAVYYKVEYADSAFQTKSENIFWSDFEHFKFDDKGNVLPPTDDNPDKENPFKVLPFVVLHLNPIPALFWNTSGGNDLIDGTKLIGMKRTLKDYLYKWQSFKQPWVRAQNADKIPDKMLSDPSKPWKIWGEGSEVGFLDLQADIRQLDETIKADMNAFLNIYGLSTDMFAATPDQSSGKALEVKNRGLRDLRQAQLPYFRNLEYDLCEMIRTVYNTYKGENAIPEIEFSIDFAEMDVFTDPMEKRNQAQWDLDHGLISPAQFYMMFNPDCENEDDAEKIIIDNMAKTKDMQGKGFNLQKYFGGADAGFNQGDVTK
jgi:hypothetical protein